MRALSAALLAHGASGPVASVFASAFASIAIRPCFVAVALDVISLEFSGEVIYWRGPSPFHFVAVPEDECRELRAISSAVSYGWGVIPVTVRIGATEWTTSLFPKDGGYLVPIRDAVRRAEHLAVGDQAAVELTVRR